jgi:hypothetical protein
MGMGLEIAGLLFLFGDLFLAKKAGDHLKEIRTIEGQQSKVRVDFLWIAIDWLFRNERSDQDMTESERAARAETRDWIGETIGPRRQSDDQLAERIRELHETFDRLVFFIKGFAVVGASFVLLGAVMQIAGALIGGPG